MSFIKLDRKIIDSEVFAHDGQLRFWLWLLLRANYKKSFAAINTGSGKKTVEVGRGQLLFGRNSASSELGVNSSTLYKWLKHFEKLEMIEAKSNKHFTVVTICKYDEYQSEEMDEVTSREQASNKPVTNQCPTSNTSKEVKEVKNNILSDTDVSDPKSYFDFETDKAKSILKCTKSADFSTLVKKSGYTLSTIILILTKRLCNKEGRDYVATGQEKKAAKELSEIMQNKKTDLIDQALLYADMITTAANTDVWRNKITAATALKYFNNIWETYKEA
jgi:transposase-like protein